MIKPNALRGLVWIGLILMISVGCNSSSSGDLTTFSQDGNSYNGSGWSPNGRWFAASVFPEESIQFFSPSGQPISTLSGCGLSGQGRDFAWVSDGRFSCFIGNEPPVLKLMELNAHGQVKKSTQIPIPLTPGTNIYDFQWNPRHFWLATIAEPRPGEGTSTLYLSDLEGRSLMSPLAINARQLAWSPDGTMLALTEPNGTILLFKVEPTSAGKLAINQFRQLAAGASDIGNLAWSPSGRWLVCRHVSYNSEDYLFLVATDGSGKEVELTSSTTDGQLDFPAWSPDGKQLIVARITASGNVLMSLDIATLLKEKGIEP